MTIFTLLRREIQANLLGFLLTILATAIAAAVPLCARSLLVTHDLQTAELLKAKEEQLADKLKYVKNEMRKATLKLKFNLLILPEGQDPNEWYAKDYGSKTMPESYVTKLANSEVVSVRHFVPSLQKPVVWPETKRRVILVGSRGEVPNLHKNPRKPLIQPVPTGTIVLGYRLHSDLGIKVGDTVRFMDREFTAHRCHEKRGSKDDITVWIPLKAAQELLDKPGQINAILALECLCVGMTGVETFRREIHKVLPNTKIVEQGSKALARAEARIKLGRDAQATLQREKEARQQLRNSLQTLTDTLSGIALAAAAFCVAITLAMNSRRRRAEFAILRALGFGSLRLLLLLLLRALSAAVLGIVMGVVLAYALASRLPLLLDSVAATQAPPSPDTAFALQIAGAVLLLVLLSAWLPAIAAVRRDPANLLGRE
ncbi:MAG: FtsX-like permease family protein [Lentisphaeria bacterium]|nr:FtsX-like permease family protein [Lentisphaeria bacterium]